MIIKRIFGLDFVWKGCWALLEIGNCNCSIFFWIKGESGIRSKLVYFTRWEKIS